MTKLVVIDKASHIDMYHVEEYVDQVIEKIDEFYKKSV